MKRIGILTGGGDAPGLNAAIKSLVYKLSDFRMEAVAIKSGWSGLKGRNVRHAEVITPNAVRTWDREGGTRIGSSRYNPFKDKDEAGEAFDNSDEVVENFEKLRLDALVAMGGEDTQSVSHRLFKEKGLPVIGIPKTIDLDLNATEYTIGFWTAVQNCSRAIERSRTPAGSHNWVQVIEVMGRHAGHLALWSGLAGGAQMILIPEVSFEFENIYKLLENRLRRKNSIFEAGEPGYAIIVVAEGATFKGGELFIEDKTLDAFGHPTLGGIGRHISRRIREETQYDSREAVLGHPQRGGPPNETDRIMGTLFGAAAAVMVKDKKFGNLVSARGVAPACTFEPRPLEEAIGSLKLVEVEKWYDMERYHVKR